MDFKKYFFILIAIIANAYVIECVTCRYSGNMTYVCVISSQIIADESEMLQIDGAHLSGKSNDDVAEVEANESEIHMFPSLIIDQFINLRSLSIADVKLKEISRPIKNCASLSYVSMNRNEFFNLPGGIFASCSELLHLSMEHCRLRTIDANAFVGTKIQSLYLTGNEIETLHPSTFAVIPRLMTLVFSNNMLSELPEDLFVNNRELLSAVFDRNNLASIPAKLLTNNPEVRFFSLTDNKITKINSGTFVNKPKLQSLYFDNNLIEEIPEFTNLLELRWMTFIGNKIKHVNGQSFKNLPSLSSLYLSNNEIETAIFQANYLPVLGFLTLHTNKLTNITGMFDSLPANLTFLNLDSNQLTYLQAGSIRPMSQLRDLRFENNKIRKIDPEFFRGATNLTVSMTRNECIDWSFEINNEVELNTTVAELLEKCYNSGQQARAGAVFLAVSVCISFAIKFL